MELKLTVLALKTLAQFIKIEGDKIIFTKRPPRFVVSEDKEKSSVKNNG